MTIRQLAHWTLPMCWRSAMLIDCCKLFISHHWLILNILTSNHNSRSVWSRWLASRSSSTNMAASRPPVEWCHFVEVNSRNIGSGHVCWGSYDGFNFAGWRGRCGSHHDYTNACIYSSTTIDKALCNTRLCVVHTLYTVSQKNRTLLPVTLPYANQFQKLFHWWTHY